MYTLNLGSKVQDIAFSGSRVDDLKWHYFEAARSGLELLFTLDNTSYDFRLAGVELTLDVDPGQFFAGGKPAVLNPYTGCLRDVRLDGISLPTEGSNGLASVTFGGTSAVAYSCSLGSCFPNPCGAGACSELTDGFTCLCPDGREGSSCPDPVPTPRYILAIALACVAVFLILCVCLVACGECLILMAACCSILLVLCVCVCVCVTAVVAHVRVQQKRSRKLLLEAVSKEEDMELYGPSQCLVISNEPGGGEADVTAAAWSSLEELSRHGSTSPPPSVINGSTKNSKEDLSEQPRANSPTIHAFIEKQVEVATIDVRDVDSVREFDEEGSLNSDATSLSSICTTSSKYTLERLKLAGPEFQQFTHALEDILSQDTQQDL